MDNSAATVAAEAALSDIFAVTLMAAGGADMASFGRDALA